MARKRIRNDPEYLEKLKIWGKERYKRNKEKLIKQATEYRLSKQEDIRYRLLRMLNSARTRSRNKNLDMDIDIDFLLELWYNQNGCCAVSGREFDLLPSSERVNKNSPSLDRIDNSKGYLKGNLRLVTWQVNAAISEYGFESFLAICQDVINFNKG